MDVLRRRRWKFVEWSSLLTVVADRDIYGGKSAVLELFFIAGLASYFIGTSKTYFSLRSNYMRSRRARGDRVGVLQWARFSATALVREYAGT